MYDIHCHVLTDTDDGADDINDSLQMCTIAANQGIHTIVATPHYIEGELETNKKAILESVAFLNNEIKERNIYLQVLPGMEIYITPRLIELYNNGDLLTLNNTKYILLELPLYNSMPSYLEDALFHLQIKGLTPVIAHPERYKAVVEDPNIVCNLIEEGCIMQLNCGSLEGLFGKTVQKTANILLEHNMVHVIASDNHSIHKRISYFGNVYKEISKKFGQALADDLFKNNPFRIINGEAVYTENPKMVKKKRFWIL